MPSTITSTPAVSRSPEAVSKPPGSRRTTGISVPITFVSPSMIGMLRPTPSRSMPRPKRIAPTPQISPKNATTASGPVSAA